MPTARNVTILHFSHLPPDSAYRRWTVTAQRSGVNHVHRQLHTAAGPPCPAGSLTPVSGDCAVVHHEAGEW